MPRRGRATPEVAQVFMPVASARLRSSLRSGDMNRDRRVARARDRRRPAGAARRPGFDLAAVARDHRRAAVPGGEPVRLSGDHQLHGRGYRRLHPRQLRGGLRARALRPGADQLARARRRGRGCWPACSPCRSPGRCRAPTCRGGASCACWCWRPSSCRPTWARSPGSCWPGPMPAGSTASTCSLTGAAAGPFNIYSFPGLVLVIALYSFPYIFVFTTAALDLVSSEMEDAANILGAGTWRTMLRVTLPLALPAILGGLSSASSRPSRSSARRR